MEMGGAEESESHSRFESAPTPCEHCHPLQTIREKELDPCTPSLLDEPFRAGALRN